MFSIIKTVNHVVNKDHKGFMCEDSGDIIPLSKGQKVKLLHLNDANNQPTHAVKDKDNNLFFFVKEGNLTEFGELI